MGTTPEENPLKKLGTCSRAQRHSACALIQDSLACYESVLLDPRGGIGGFLRMDSSKDVSPRLIRSPC